MRRDVVATVGVAIALCSVTQAQVVSRAPDDVEIAIYRGPSGSNDGPGLAMISEDRTVVLPGGPTTIQFHGVTEAIVPQTAALEGLPTPVIESNFDYDLLTPGSIIANSVGLPVRIVRTNRDTGNVTEQRAVLRSGPQGVMLEVDGRFEALGCSGLDERLVFDSLPASLAASPMLSMPVIAPAGRYKLRLSYLTLGMSWSADYVAKLNSDGRTLDLTGWVTLTNRLGNSYASVPVKAIAGNLSFFGDETVAPGARSPESSSACWPVGHFYQAARNYREKMEELAAAMPPMMMEMRRITSEEIVVTGSHIVATSELGDYKLYSLPERTQVASNQTKQVRLLDKRKVRFDRVHVYRFDADTTEEEQGPMVTLRLENRANRGLGLPLPAGTISVLETSAGNGMVLAGEDKLQDVPVGLPMEIQLGESLGVWAKPRVVVRERLGTRPPFRSRLQMEVLVGNDKDVAATVELRHLGLTESEVRFVSESKAHRLRYGEHEWSFSLPPGGRAALRYTIEVNE